MFYMCYILRHYTIEHSNFYLICNVNNCELRYSNIQSYRKHLKKHKVVANNMTLLKVTHQGDRSSLDAASVSEKEIIERGNMRQHKNKYIQFRLWQARGSICKTIHKLQALKGEGILSRVWNGKPWLCLPGRASISRHIKTMQV